jgi:hypothetical protein
MNRLLSAENLDLLIELVEDKFPDEKYQELHDYLVKTKGSYGGGTLYALCWEGAIASQHHLSTFDKSWWEVWKTPPWGAVSLPLPGG